MEDSLIDENLPISLQFLLRAIFCVVLFFLYRRLYFSAVVNINFFQPGILDVTLPFPTEWNELYPEELEAISAAQLTEQTIPAGDKIQILRELLSFRSKRESSKLPEDFFSRLDPEAAVLNGLTLLDFIYDDNTLTKQPYHKLAGYVGPADDFNSITCGEFEDCEIFYHQFKEDPSPESLARLAAVLYRPKGVPYIDYNSQTECVKTYAIDDVLAQFLKMDGAILYTIFTWYTGCRKNLTKYFPTAFENDGSTTEDEPNMLAFTECIHSGAGVKNGNRSKIRVTLLKEFFLELELEARKAKELRKQYEQMKR